MKIHKIYLLLVYPKKQKKTKKKETKKKDVPILDIILMKLCDIFLRYMYCDRNYYYLFLLMIGLTIVMYIDQIMYITKCYNYCVVTRLPNRPMSQITLCFFQKFILRYLFLHSYHLNYNLLTSYEPFEKRISALIDLQ